LRHHVSQGFLFGIQAAQIKIPKENFQVGFLHVDDSGVRVHKADATFSRFRQHVFGKARQVVSRSIHRVHHDSFGSSRMRALAFEGDGGRAGAPRFIADLAE
jgi:hypothetical protein